MSFNMEGCYCYEVHASTPDGDKVTFPVANDNQGAIDKALAVFPRGSRVTLVKNEDTGKEWRPGDED